jgi:ubiquinone/menaquinone biosynthesis C-methylase UbiE
MTVLTYIYFIQELSTVFPRSTFIGIDINEDYPKQVKPKNCHFRKCNVVGDLLPFPDNSIGYIFQRDLNWGLQASDWTSLIQEYHRVLKPGGWIELVEPDIETQQSASKERTLHEKSECAWFSNNIDIFNLINNF